MDTSEVSMSRHWQAILALLATVTLLLRPVLCDCLHAMEEFAEEYLHSSAQRHSHDEHASQGEHVAVADSFAKLTEAHHCCGGHERPPDMVTQKANAQSADDSRTATTSAVPPALQSWPAIHSCRLVSHALIDMPASPIAQGIPCALLCRWLI